MATTGDTTADLFISYSWTSNEHRVWVHQFANHLRAIGHTVLLDADVDYGEPLATFMSDVALQARHVLLIVDPAYVIKADTIPGSGVAAETRAFQRVRESRATNWLSVVWKDNPEHLLPAWLMAESPKSFTFNADPSVGVFPGSEQVESVWRWLQGLPADKSKSVPPSAILRRAARIERSRHELSPERWVCPDLKGQVTFPFTETPSNTFQFGYADYLFGLHFSGGPPRLYRDHHTITRIGVLPDKANCDPASFESALTARRSVKAAQGSRIVVENQWGVLCLLEFTGTEYRDRSNDSPFESVTFEWTVFNEW